MDSVNTAHRRPREHRCVSPRTYLDGRAVLGNARHQIGDRRPTGDCDCTPRQCRRGSGSRSNNCRSRGGHEGGGAPLMAVVGQHTAEQREGRCSTRRAARAGKCQRNGSRSDAQGHRRRRSTSPRYDQTMVLHCRPATQDPMGWLALWTAWNVSVTVADPPCRALGASSGRR